MNETAMFAFLMVFLRASAMMLSSPVFGAQTTPITIRVLVTASISAALTFVVKHSFGPIPTSLYDLAAVGVHEILAGLLIGSFMSLAMQIGQIAGSIMDIQVGLSSSQIMNPVSGIQVTVLAQYKFMLGVVLFLTCDAHHIVIRAFVRSYDAMPGLNMTTFPLLQDGLIHLVTAVSLLSIQIAAPVMAIALLLDGTFGLINRAVPQIQIMQVGLPAKLCLGLVAVSFALPAMTVAVESAVNQAIVALGPLLHQ
jgi:flagellar biosynthetic protein FliR